MRKISFTKIIFLSCLILFFSGSIFSQTPTATPPNDDGDVVKISTTLIQLDVVVTDKKGNQITDLQPEDFEIYENGKKQDISNFSYIFNKNTQQPTNSQPSITNSKDKFPIPPPPSKLKLEQIRRTYALVVDDLGLSFTNVYWVQHSLKKFIKNQMQEGDLVAIIRTGSGIGALQSFTSDKRLLFAAIDRIKWNSQGRGGIGDFAPIRSTLKDNLDGKISPDGKITRIQGREEEIESENLTDEFRIENFAVGTLGALSYIIRGMRDLPGRKSLMLVSEGFPGSPRMYYSLKILADLANRSSVVIYTLDPRGLEVSGMVMAEDDVSGTGNSRFQLRGSKYFASQQTLRFLADETGGIPYVNQNDLVYGLKKAIKDQSGYYLIGYQPDSDVFDPKKSKFNKLKVKLKRDGLKVRYRSGFFGITDKEVAQVNQTPQRKIYSALTSPFNAGDISLSVNTLFAEDEKNGEFIRSLVKIDANDLKFTQETDGIRKANFDLIAMTFGDNGVPIDSVAKNYTLQVNEKIYRKILENGFIYNLVVPIKKPGAYQFRIALRDSASEKVGSASQFIEVPNLKKNDLTISGILLNNYTINELQKISTKDDQDNNQTSVDLDTASRRFKRGTVLRYDYIIYNAKTNPTNLQVQARLFSNSKLLIEGQPSALNTNDQNDLKRIEAAGAITLGKNLEPGNYILQVIVIDANAKEKRQIATRSIDFEIVE